MKLRTALNAERIVSFEPSFSLFLLQALLFNILPAHVAHHFLRKDIHQRDEQLYSQSYTSVGVLFASIPNFSGSANIK